MYEFSHPNVFAFVGFNYFVRTELKIDTPLNALFTVQVFVVTSRITSLEDLASGSLGEM